MKIDTNLIKKLRDNTGAGIMECKTALFDNKGDLKKAQECLRRLGIEKADKKAGKKTSEGVIEMYIHATGKVGAMIELSCETDFVARTDDFKKLAHEVAMQVASMDPKNVPELLKQEYIRDLSMTVHELIKSVIAKVGENIVVKRFVRMEMGE